MSWGDVLLIAGGFGAGFLSGTIGIGGGLLFVPTMTVGFRISQAVAQGTSLVAIVPTAIVGGITHIREGNVLGSGAAFWCSAPTAFSCKVSKRLPERLRSLTASGCSA
ncbi:MAG: hypothetical protein E6H83_01005 [Chloroflexi bacterium]|nr:MAG: hypothetical protein E6H83_01005 [Chloroflexota bacterium]